MAMVTEARSAMPTALPTNGHYKAPASKWKSFLPPTTIRRKTSTVPAASPFESYFDFLRSLFPSYKKSKMPSRTSNTAFNTPASGPLPTAANAAIEDVMRGESTYEIPHTDILSWLFKSNYDHGQKILIDGLNPERFVTANAIKSMVRSLIGGLRGIGVKPGDSVCIHSFNDILYPIAALAVVGIGARFVGTNPGHTVFEMEHHLKISHSKFMIIQPSLIKHVAQAAEKVGIPHGNIVAFDVHGEDAGGYHSFMRLLQAKEEDWISFQDEKTAKETIIGLFASSGTTGLPKVIAVSHYAWVAGTVLLPEVLERPYKVRRLMFLPAFHAFACPLTILMPIKMGQETYVLPRFDLATFCEAVGKYQINETAVAPPCLQAFMKAGEEKQKQLRSLKRIWCGGAPMNVKLQTESRACFADDAEIVNIWGMTEFGITVAMRYDEIDRTGAASKLLPNTEARIINDDGLNVTLKGGQGEVQIRTPQVSLGYFGNTKATDETFISGGWVRTGDVAYFKDGKLYILDRKKEIIKVRGWQVAPAELEAVLVSHPGIKDAAVLGIKVGTGDGEHEVPRAYVVRMPGAEIREEDVKKFILEKLAKYKALDGGVFFVEAIPKSNTGKILKKIIRAEWIGKEEAQRKLLV
ncbi:S-dihydroxybenzoyltransferase [Drechslerella dactyloides]|uniref:S-dihydroxybenzoyltransferase n=1 Tax=Drechslerella dactyloides TaxID=74499 RepID=A0AAD6J3K0_DREDA|nr:S-dihydroxybenzoyltransferase [Drechslerella dactyloides]